MNNPVFYTEWVVSWKELFFKKNYNLAFVVVSFVFVNTFRAQCNLLHVACYGSA